jgi:hypothetical protein
MKDSKMQRILGKVAQYPRWATFNIVSVVLVTICILVSAPLFVKIWKPQNEADSAKLTFTSTVQKGTQQLRALPPLNATPAQRVEVSWRICFASSSGSWSP